MARPVVIYASFLLALAAVVVDYGQLYPGKRLVDWMEVCLDGMAPDWLSRDAAKVTGHLWTEAFRHCSRKKESSLPCFVQNIVETLENERNGRTCIDMMELAAGSGTAPKLWSSAFQEADLQVRTVLTDIQPHPETWEELGLDYVKESVDATSAGATVVKEYPDFGKSKDSMEVRMIHLALHHLEPSTVQSVFQDAVESGAVMVVGDLSPTLGGVLLNGFLSFEFFLRILFQDILYPAPLKILLAPFLPLILLGLWHDATVSVLRSYSVTELQGLLDKATASTGNPQYRVKIVQSESFAQFLGLPAILPAFQDPILQFFVAIPDNKSSFVIDERTVNHHATAPSGAAAVAAAANFQAPNCTVSEYHLKESQLLTREYHPVSIAVLLLLFLTGVSYSSSSSTKSSSSSSKSKHNCKKQRSGNKTASQKRDVGEPAILAIGKANPPFKFTQQDYFAKADQGKLFSDSALEFFKARVKNSGVESRYNCTNLDMYTTEKEPTTHERHLHWNEWAPKLAIEASKKALDNWGGHKKSEITHVIFHSCTGFKAPGVELDIVDGLGLTNVRRRLGINYMGCFGGFTGMAVAKSFVETEPDVVVLLVCVELCSLHFSLSDNPSMAIGNAVFSDGAAAVLIGAGNVGDWVIGEQRTRTMDKSTRGYMTWAPHNTCYDMYLDKKIGFAFGKDLFLNLNSTIRNMVGNDVKKMEWCVHPGGKKLLEYFCSKGGLNRHDLRHSFEVMRNYGNMSSPTIFFVIDQMMQETNNQAMSSSTTEGNDSPPAAKTLDTAIGLGFGPGLTLELVALHRILGADNAAE